jgi:hypothetical protein
MSEVKFEVIKNLDIVALTDGSWLVLLAHRQLILKKDQNIFYDPCIILLTVVSLALLGQHCAPRHIDFR